MKLASLKAGRDGRLVVVSRDLARCTPAEGIAPTLQAALESWSEAAPRLRRLAEDLETGRVEGQALRPGCLRRAAAARLPVARRLGLRHPRRAGAQGARRRAAGALLERSADVSGRLRRLRRPARADRGDQRGLGHRSRGGGRGDHRSGADGHARRARRRAHQARAAGQRRDRAGADPGRARQRASASCTASPPRRSRRWR